MKKSRFSEEQRIGVLQEGGSGDRGAGGLPPALDWRPDVLPLEVELQDREVAEARQLRPWEEENRRRQQRVAEQARARKLARR